MVRLRAISGRLASADALLNGHVSARVSSLLGPRKRVEPIQLTCQPCKAPRDVFHQESAVDGSAGYLRKVFIVSCEFYAFCGRNHARLQSSNRET